MKRILSQRIGALILTMAISLSLVSPCVSYAVEDGCPLQEHQHTSECYKLPDSRRLNCSVTAHSHAPECYDGAGALVCGCSDKIIHMHDENCYDEDGELVCCLPEYEAHTHTEDCYEESKVLVCQEADAPVIPHEHTESCYEAQEKCVCGQEDDETHIHTDECFQTERVLVCTEDETTNPHTHTDACYETHRTLVCGKNDLVPHFHRDECRDMNGRYICGLLETVAHQHDDSCFVTEEGGVSETPLCGLEEHKHSEACQPNQSGDTSTPPSDEESDNKPTVDDPTDDGIMTEPDEIRDEAGSSNTGIQSKSASFVPIARFDIGNSALTATLEQISGVATIMVTPRTFTLSSSGLYSLASLYFTQAGNYSFRLSCDGRARYFDLNITVTEFNGSFGVSASWIQMPEGITITGYPRFNDTGSLGTVSFTPVVRKNVPGGNASFSSYYKLENRSSNPDQVIMPSSTVVQVSSETFRNFSAISLTNIGVYQFYIKKVADANGTELSNSVPGWTLTITVTELNGGLKASGVYRSEADGTENTTGAIFTESFCQYSPMVEVYFIGEAPHSASFRVNAKSVYPSVGYNSGEKSVSGNERGQLYPITFTKPGTYEFLITESLYQGCRDTREYTLSVAVTEENGELKATGAYSVGGGLNRNPAECATFIHVKKNAYSWSTTTETKARRLLSQMTLDEKVGQLFLLHYSDTTVRTAADIKAITDKYHPGGYIVFQPDLQNESPESFKAKIDRTQKDSKIPLIISIDEEGGKVNRASSLPQYRSSAYPGPQDLKANGGLSAVLADAADKAAFLENLGINLNHAPVADVASTGYIYARTWGGDGLDNAGYVETAVRGMEEAGMGTTLKHFPGYGSTSSNTHNGFAVNYLSETDFKYNDLLPFYAGINAGSQSVMVTHNTINYLDDQNPASLSPAVYNLLRNQLGFEGLAITDDLNMNAVTNYVGDGNQSLAALKAGADMALVPYPDKQIPPVLAAAKSGELPLSRIDESCFRVLCWKIEHGLMDNVTDLFADEVDVSIPMKVIIDGVPTQIGEITKARLENSSSSDANYRIPLEEVTDLLGEFGFDIDRYVGTMVFGTQLSSDGKLTFSQNSINKIDGEWMLSLPSGANLDNISVMFASKAMVNGSYDIELIASDCGFYSVRVNDVAGSVSEELDDVSSVHYYPAGASTELTLPQRPAPLTWILNKTDNPAFSYQITTQDGIITIKLNNIFSPIVITSGAEEIVTYTVQYYGLIDAIDKSSTGTLDIIDTSGGVLPQNGSDNIPKIMKLTLNDDGTVKTTQSIKKLYLEETFRYRDAPDLSYIDKLKTFDAHYEPVELWVLKDDKSAESTVREDWDIYNKDDLGLKSFYDLSLTNISNGVESPTTVVLKNNATVRILYVPTGGTSETPVDFWDYDITDGYIYSDKNLSVKRNTSSQSNSWTAYANTFRQGINSPNNYSNDGSRFSFGNANTGSGWHIQELDGMYFNQFNRSFSGVTRSYKGCFFGLPVRLDSNGIIFRDGVSVPDLFGETPLTGKTAVNGKSLQFIREGDTYTLEAVGGTNTKNLSSFRHPGIYDGIQHKTVIWSNDFWPMDSSSTFGADGHDLIFGRKDIASQRKIKNIPQTTEAPYEWGNSPVSDDFLDHNSYFGMHFTVDFTLPHDYCGDLEYLFFGDDDIWMFLDGKLVLDIGGVHSAVGEYVNLWDYIEQGDTSPHQLQFYYLERGASGSTCWIQYTIPSAKVINGSTGYDNSLRIQKTLLGDEENNRDFAFTVNLENGDGSVLQGEYPCITYDKQGNILSVETMRDGETLLLSDGCYAVIRGLPDYVTYTITESKYDCDTYVQEGALDLSVIPGNSANLGESEYPGESGVEEETEEEIGGEESEEGEVAGGESNEEAGGKETGGGEVGVESGYLTPSREITGTVYGGTIVEVNYINVFSSIAELPETGGPGLQSVTAIGITVVAVGIGFFWFRKKRSTLI